MVYKTVMNQSKVQRVSMLVLSLALIVITLSTQGPLGWKVAFPLLAIYPGIIALTGWDPVYAAMVALWSRISGAPAPVQAGV